MFKQTITGIQRASLFSPNHIGNDAAIFTNTADYLKEKGYHVKTYTEQNFLSIKKNPEYVFAMLRNQNAIAQLQKWEEEGCKSVNSAFGIKNCGREHMTKLLVKHNIPYPESIIADTNEDITQLLEKISGSAYWLKRGDFHAIHREDVTYVRHNEEVREMLSEYALRGIERVVINKHLKGDLIKFYGVAGTSFFHWFYPFDKHSKFGLEKINGKAKGISFEEEELREICRQAAEVLRLTVYGGDCIISPDGKISIIDFNDWPSFAPCRKEAATAIGEAIIKEISS